MIKGGDAKLLNLNIDNLLLLEVKVLDNCHNSCHEYVCKSYKDSNFNWQMTRKLNMNLMLTQSTFTKQCVLIMQTFRMLVLSGVLVLTSSTLVALKHVSYIDVCNQVVSANRLHLYPCKLHWFKTIHKFITLFIHMYSNHIPKINSNHVFVNMLINTQNNAECQYISMGQPNCTYEHN